MQTRTQAAEHEPSTTKGSPRTAWKWILAVMVILAGVHFLPLIQSHAEQDNCSFGPVSNERYRELLAEAKRKQAAEWPPLVWRKRAAEKLLQARFEDISQGSVSIYERLAAMHAVMRALGADYRSTEFGDDPFQAALKGGGIVAFNYHLDVNRLGFFRPIRRQIWMMGRLSVKEAYGPFMRELNPGEFFFTVHFPEFLDTYITIPRSYLGEVCPPVPPTDLADRLNRSI